LNNNVKLYYPKALYNIYVSASTNGGLYLELLKDAFLTYLFRIENLLSLRLYVENINEDKRVFSKLMEGIRCIGGDDLKSGENSLRSTSNVMEGFEEILLSEPRFDKNIISRLFYINKEDCYSFVRDWTVLSSKLKIFNNNSHKGLDLDRFGDWTVRDWTVLSSKLKIFNNNSHIVI